MKNFMIKMEESSEDHQSIKTVLEKMCATRCRYYDLYVRYLERMQFAVQNRNNVPVYVATKYYEETKNHYNMVVYLDIEKSHVYAVFSTKREKKSW